MTSGAESSDVILAAIPRVTVDTPSLGGSIDLKGGMLDDLTLKAYRETIDPNSPTITLFSPPGGPNPYWAETGYIPAAGSKAPIRDTVWTSDRNGPDRREAGDARL